MMVASPADTTINRFSRFGVRKDADAEWRDVFPAGGFVDIAATEAEQIAMEHIAWLRQFGGPTGGAIAFSECRREISRCGVLLGELDIAETITGWDSMTVAIAKLWLIVLLLEPATMSEERP